MDAPFGILFLKKVELYNLVEDQRKKVEVMKSLHPESNNPITWPVEEKILKWTYHGHKYLTDSIKENDFVFKKSRKLKDWELLNEKNEVKEEYKKAVNQPKSILKNMVAREFARYDDDDPTSIIINKEGLLLGEVIYNSQHENRSIKCIYKIYSCLFDYVGAWILFIIVIITIIMTLSINLWNIFNQL